MPDDDKCVDTSNDHLFKAKPVVSPVDRDGTPVPVAPVPTPEPKEAK